jgi:hypothetical protein
MGEVSTIVIAGLDLWFNSSDHGPPHFHARRPDHWEIRVYIASTTRKKLVFSSKWPRNGVKVPGRLRRLLRQATATNREALLAEWEAKVLVVEDRR